MKNPSWLSKSIKLFILSMKDYGFTDNEIHVTWLKVQTVRINHVMKEQCRIYGRGKEVGDWLVDKRRMKKDRRYGYERVPNENPLVKKSILRNMKRES
jgi:hypothetical protein